MRTVYCTPNTGIHSIMLTFLNQGIFAKVKSFISGQNAKRRSFLAGISCKTKGSLFYENMNLVYLVFT